MQGGTCNVHIENLFSVGTQEGNLFAGRQQCSTTVQCGDQERNHWLDTIHSQKAEDDTTGCERSIQETSTVQQQELSVRNEEQRSRGRVAVHAKSRFTTCVVSVLLVVDEVSLFVSWWSFLCCCHNYFCFQVSLYLGDLWHLTSPH